MALADGTFAVGVGAGCAVLTGLDTVELDEFSDSEGVSDWVLSELVVCDIMCTQFESDFARFASRFVAQSLSVLHAISPGSME